MNNERLYFWTTISLLGIFSGCFAGTNDSSDFKNKQSGFVGIELGQIVHGYQDTKHGGGDNEINKGTLERMLFQYVNDREVSEHIRVNLAIECQLSYSFPYGLDATWEMKLPKFSFYPDRAEGTYTIGDPRLLQFQFGSGYFPFRFNTDAKNLGEYLFRTGTYPLYVLNYFNRPYSRLLGLRTSFRLLEDLKLEALLTTSTLIPPLANGSLSFIADYNLMNILDMGAGISLANFFPVDNELTTPTGNAVTQYVTKTNDTLYYTFKGIKPTAKISIDPKPLIPGDLFNKNDLKLYGEVCVSGWKNYKNYGLVDTSDTAIAQFYARRSDRTVYMMGFNAPSFFKPMGKLLTKVAGLDVPFLSCLDFDVLSFEYEYMPNKYPNSLLYLSGVTVRPLPYPSISPSIGNEKVYPWYWTVYAKKTFLNNFALIIQFSRDHLRPINNDPGYLYVEDVLERKGDWWWNVRLNVKY